MLRLSRAASLLAALALAACADHSDLVAPSASPLAPGARSSALTTSNGNGDLTAVVDGPDVVAPGGTATYTVSLSAPTAPTVLTSPLDVVFVLDASGSEGSANFHLEKSAVVSQINNLAVGTYAHVGVVEFSTAVTTAYTFTQNQSAATIINVVDNLPYTAQETYTLKAMQAALNIFKAGERPGAQHVIVMLTDGTPNPSLQNPCGTTTAAAHLRDSLATLDINTFVLGVGASLNPGTLSCLYDNDPTRFIPVANFTGIEDALHQTFDQFAGIQAAEYTATLPAGFTVGALSAPNAHVSNGVVTWDAGVISGSTLQLPIALTAPADFCGTTPTLTKQKVRYLNAGTADSLALPDQAITSTVSCDVTGPVIAPTITGPRTGDWYTGNVTVHWDVTDPESAVSAKTGCDDVTISTNTDASGTAITCSATSGGGNSSQTVTIKRDATVPTVTASIVGAQTNGWYTGSPVVSFTEAYGPSGAGSLSGCGPFTVTHDGAFSYTCAATSAAGLTGTATASGSRDTTNPVITITGNAGSYTLEQQVAITCSASDATSGIASSTCADVAGPAYGFDATNSYTMQATDRAGHTATASVAFTVDVTADGIIALIDRFVSGTDANLLAVRVRDIADKLAKNSPALGAQMKNFQAELGKAQRDGQLSAGDAAVLWRLVQQLH